MKISVKCTAGGAGQHRTSRPVFARITAVCHYSKGGGVADRRKQGFGTSAGSRRRFPPGHRVALPSLPQVTLQSFDLVIF